MKPAIMDWPGSTHYSFNHPAGTISVRRDFFMVLTALEGGNGQLVVRKLKDGSWLWPIHDWASWKNLP
jgi:hypothetical protein